MDCDEVLAPVETLSERVSDEDNAMNSGSRWLSLEACVNRLVEQYDALLSYFRSTDDKQAVVKRVKNVLEKPLTKAYLLFLSVSLPIINNFNKSMQQQSPVHMLHQELEGLIRKLMLRFMQVRCVTDTADVTAIDIDDTEKYLPLEEIFIGSHTMQYIEDEVSISSSDVHSFRETCLAWWHMAVREAIKRLPLGHSLLCNVHWLQPGLQQYDLMSKVLVVAECLPQVVKLNEKPSLQEEYMDYCMLPLPVSIKTEEAVDKFWHAVSEIQDISGQKRYPILTKLAKAVLIIPHGNADTERLFSHVGLNKTKHRNCLGLPALNALLSVQFNIPEPCYNYKPSQGLLKQCKNAVAEAQQSC